MPRAAVAFRDELAVDAEEAEPGDARFVWRGVKRGEDAASAASSNWRTRDASGRARTMFVPTRANAYGP